MKYADIEAMKKQAVNEAVDTAFFLMLAIPTMVIHDKFSKLMKKDGREATFAELCIDLYELYKEGYVDVADLHKILEDEAGLKITK